MQPPIPNPCPFCGQPAQSPRCTACGRDPIAPRRICMKCRRATPTAEPMCMHCAAPFHSDMWWKLPLIIGLFVAAFILALILAMLK